jgi:large subunit ribosomal protein L3
MANESMGLIGRKLGMTQIFDDDTNAVIPVTVIDVGTNKVLRTKTTDSKDGYSALQLGFGTQKAHRLTKADIGQLKLSGSDPVRAIREIRVSDEEAGKHEVGASLAAADVFEEGTKVDVTGTSKGRGFAGVMKRHNFAGFIRTHGTHEFFRHGGSIGTRLTPGMTLKGKKMPGHMGAERVTVQNLKVARVDAERNLVFVKGGVPGPNGGLVVVRNAVKG